MSQLLPPPTPPITPVPRVTEPDTLYEVVNGEFKEKNVGAREIRLGNLIAYKLRPFVHERGWGDIHMEMIFRLAPGLPQRRPDLAFVSYVRWARERPVPDASAWEVVPDLAVEVVSPTDFLHDVYLKVHEYFAAGVRSVWLVIPPVEQVHVFGAVNRVSIFGRDDQLADEALFPGFRLPLAEIFEREPAPPSEGNSAAHP